MAGADKKRSQPFSWPVRVYYQHTDAGGMVFHGNYLGFMEAARTEMMQSLGFNLGELARRDQIVFVVHSLQITYHKPALLGDQLAVTAHAAKITPARLVLEQNVMRGEEMLASAEVTLACVDARSQRPIPLPDLLRKNLQDNT